MSAHAGVTPEQQLLLQGFLDELAHWNERVNLTAVPPDLAWERHIGDSLRLSSAAPAVAGDVCIDVGTGGGVPGIPLAILRPDIEMVLLDSDRKKVGFLTYVCGLLGLDNVSTLTARAEDAGHDPVHREAYDLAVSRATAGAPALCELCLPLVRVGGRMAAILRTAPLAAAEARVAAQACGGGEPVAAAPEVMVVSKVTSTEAQYPRRAGIPVRRPLV